MPSFSAGLGSLSAGGTFKEDPKGCRAVVYLRTATLDSVSRIYLLMFNFFNNSKCVAICQRIIADMSMRIDPEQAEKALQAILHQLSVVRDDISDA